jgi:hypothetical protein
MPSLRAAPRRAAEGGRLCRFGERDPALEWQLGALRRPTDDEVGEGVRYAVWPIAAVVLVPQVIGDCDRNFVKCLQATK